ncbi:hypothetical protein E2C01_002225 [Portunus trituberculatus]|uniref:Uncharacterized protein n=1 Tax=Portunus trituberculatus TaxID=210409 RepID=A0A5B7CIV3_PORTR|nr:hypothetical protein [Portunus trituberculatus]
MLWPIVPVGIFEEYMWNVVNILPITGTGNFIYSGSHIRTHTMTCFHIHSAYYLAILYSFRNFCGD